MMLEELRKLLTVERTNRNEKSSCETTIPTGGAGRNSYNVCSRANDVPVPAVDCSAGLSGEWENQDLTSPKVYCGEGLKIQSM
jgi:hypothetical protein